MAILDSIESSSTKTGVRAVFAGVEGVGKTTLACSAPRPLLIPLEQGFTGVNIQKVPMLEHFDHVMALLDEIIAKAQEGTFPYQTLVFDSFTALERLIHQAVIATDPLYAKGNKKGLIMDNALGGYGKAYNLANEMFDQFLKKCDQLVVYAGINIVATCHVFASKINDPSVGEYSSWDLLLHSPKNEKTYGKREMTTQWADIVGFLHEPIYVTENAAKTMARGISANKGRILAVNRTPAYVAKNRFGMVTEGIAIPKDNFGWNYLAHAMHEANGFDCYNRGV